MLQSHYRLQQVSCWRNSLSAKLILGIRTQYRRTQEKIYLKNTNNLCTGSNSFIKSPEDQKVRWDLKAQSVMYGLSKQLKVFTWDSLEGIQWIEPQKNIGHHQVGDFE